MCTGVIGGSPDQCICWGVQGLELHSLWDGVVGTNSQNLVSSHQDSVEMFAWVEEDFDVTDATLLPLATIPVPSVQFGALLEQDLLIFLSRLCLHLRDKYSADVWGSVLHSLVNIHLISTIIRKCQSSALLCTSGNDTMGSKWISTFLGPSSSSLPSSSALLLGSEVTNTVAPAFAHEKLASMQERKKKRLKKISSETRLQLKNTNKTQQLQKRFKVKANLAFQMQIRPCFWPVQQKKNQKCWTQRCCHLQLEEQRHLPQNSFLVYHDSIQTDSV